jgi:RNA polymerase sigma factor (sigma-70 family)
MAWLRDVDIWFADHVFVFHDQHRRYALSLVRQREEAEELVQEAYARLFALDNWASITHPHAFTMRIIRNLAIERFRRAEVVRLDQSALLHRLELADQDPTPDVVAMDRSELRHVVRVMQDMPPRMREAIYLRRIEGLPPAQVAERMSISVSTVETHLVKALRLLVERLDRREAKAKAKAERTTAWETKERLEQI